MAGGGTGGHVMPALAVARELRARGHDVHFVGTRRGIEAKIVPDANFPIDFIEIGGLNRVGFQRTIATLGELPLSVWHASRILDRLRPNAIFSTGGYVAGPVLLAALWKKLPVIVMEPNAMPGFTHRRLAPYVARALVSFEETAAWFPEGRTEVTGLPVRSELFSAPPKPKNDPPVLLITGGSQGSRTLNRAMEQSWPLWRKNEIRLLHQTGKAAFEALEPAFRASGLMGEIAPFFDDLPEKLASANLAVGRSGMGTLSELAASGTAAILVPLPGAADQHQLKNAEAFANAGAARLVLDAEATGQRMVDEIREMLRTPGLLDRMGQSARTFARPGAAARAAEILEEYLP
jgi:UDP-N-acetylglucosamine--N-acetylmuramyl-(pentapeptide) pyrophosphoryl-undecaprenol N-acetylglucosamine transferase